MILINLLMLLASLAIKRNCKFILFGTNIDYFKSQKNAFYVSDDKQLIYVGTNRYMEPIYDPMTFLKAAKLLCKKIQNLDL